MHPFFLSLLVTLSVACAGEPVATRTVEHLGDQYIVVTVRLGGEADLLFYGGLPGGITFAEARDAAVSEGRTVVALTNGGMYEPDLRPVGLFVARGSELRPIVSGDGAGNFYLRPNGVFWTDTSGLARVTVTEEFPTDRATVWQATQSGPMLLIDGSVHPEFESTSVNRASRSGVGVSADGKTVHLAVSKGDVRFHDFATLFRDELACDSALFLDGVVSKLWTAGELPTDRYGAVIAVTRRKTP